MATDMRAYAERLSQAMPERFVFTEGANGGRWYVGTHDDDIGIDYASKGAEQWAFWGPLGSEFGIKSLNPHLYKDQYDQHSGSGYYKFDDLLEALANAVCQEAERRAQDK